MKKALFFLLIALVAFSYCSKDKASAPDAAGASQPDQAQAQSQAGGEQGQSQAPFRTTEEPALRIKAASLQPETPTVADDVVAKPQLADPGLENIDFRYRWFVSGREVAAVNGAKLEKGQFKKGDWLYCLIQAAGEMGESDWFKSDVIRVLNTLPVFHLAPIENFNVPGEVVCQAAASDADNDALTYELLAPLEQGIVVDPNTGAISWKIDADTVARLGETIEIKLAVSDGGGAKVMGTITLKLTSTKQTQPQ